jgi:uncharacterized membrane protein YeaQ/YmgE (transglycosylase-associated protein family)
VRRAGPGLLLWGTSPYLSNHSLLVIIIMDVVAGWRAGQIVSGGGFRLIGDLIVGVIGAFIGDWLAPRLGIQPQRRRLPLIINATIAAIVLLLIIRLVSGNRRRLLGKPLRSPLVRVCSALRFFERATLV